ncbi:MAG: CHC2 zinc finger domain-containing protein [Methylotenera sp.]|nr:CHC2 zinc finger domain-containing protein [Methylotenera sp.]
MSALNNVLSRLDKVQRIGDGRYKAICPAHDDRTPSLNIKDDGGRLLLHCFGGCETSDVLGAIGLDFSDIMPDKTMGNFKKDRKPFYAMDILRIIKFEVTLTYIYASDMAKGLALTSNDKERLLLASSRINHAYEVAKNGL